MAKYDRLLKENERGENWHEPHAFETSSMQKNDFFLKKIVFFELTVHLGKISKLTKSSIFLNLLFTQKIDFFFILNFLYLFLIHFSRVNWSKPVYMGEKG